MSDVTTTASATGASESTADWGSTFDSLMVDTSADTAVETAEADTGDVSDDPDTGESGDAVETESAEAGDDQGEESEAAAETPVEAAEPTEANDDYVIRERYGKKEMVFKPGRGEMIYGAYKAAQEAETLIGEPLTRDAVEARQNAFIDQQSIIADFLSGEASAEANVLNYFAQIAESARQNGEVAHDPLTNLAARIPDFFAKNQQAYAALAQPVLRNALAEIKADAREAAAKDPQNDALALSIEYVEAALFKGQYEPREKFLKVPDPVDARLRDIEQREARLNQQAQTERQRAWTEYSQQVNASVRSTVAAAVDGALKSVEKAYEAFPQDFKAVKDQLHREFNERVKNDAAWRARLDALTRKAQNMATPSAREAVKTELLAMFKAKAEYLLDPVRNESVKGILASRAAQIKATSDAKHQRLQTAAAQRAPGTPGAAVSQSASRLPKGIVSDPGGWAKIFD